MGISERDGIAQRLLEHLFSGHLSQKIASIRVSFYQIYNEKIIDLLDLENGADLAVKLHPFEGVVIDGLSEYEVEDVNEALGLLARGYAARKVRDNSVNKHSSRSHTVLQVVCLFNQSPAKSSKGSPLKALTKNYSKNRSKLCVVDLAGSEKYAEEAAQSKAHLSELKNINRSLACLTKVVAQLASGYSHVHFRESKLTRVLQDSLGGQTPVLLIATLSPAL